MRDEIVWKNELLITTSFKIIIYEETILKNSFEEYSKIF